jgi:hypothetical protein
MSLSRISQIFQLLKEGVDKGFFPRQSAGCPKLVKGISLPADTSL